MNFKAYSDAWLEAVNDKDTSKMAKTLSDKFIWFNDRYDWSMDKSGTIEWCIETNFTASDFSCLYENNEVIVGTHNVVEPGAPDSSVLFIAKIKDNQIISHQYLREFER